MKKILACIFALCLCVTPVFAADQTVTWTDPNAAEEGYKIDVMDTNAVLVETVIVPQNSTTATYDCTLSTCCYEVYAFATGLADSSHSAKVCKAIPVLNAPVLTGVNNN